ncbi:glycerol-3-phosphate acyltransferase 3 [Adelges cooleyi]|uniref:glycerol-3-phosphate acyltransferase 3 n=1 Tax=Adelges cooleyi TaxID=133065 RepID=UPI00217F7575|nr:glycerol-3-phosphate acyltransferase 3 [Adelges cooleyi]
MSSILIVDTLSFTILFIIFIPFLIFFLGIVLLAYIGKTLGIRRIYVEFLVKVFEYGRENLEKQSKKKKKIIEETDGEETDDVDEPCLENSNDESVLNKHITDANPDVVDANGSITRNSSSHSLSNGVDKKVQNGAPPLISRQDLILVPDPDQNYNGNNNVKIEGGKQILQRTRSFNTLKREFELADVLDYVKTGVEAIIEDQVTSRFEAEELKSWNLLTRTNRHYEFINWKITVIWMIGFVIRYTFLLPLRVLICFFGVMWLWICTFIVGFIPDSLGKRWLNHNVSIMCFQVLSAALSSVITYHNRENLPKRGICVANHTSPIDVLVLACDNTYALIGQRHGGFLGILQRALARASPHLWFERSEVKDREIVARRLREHVSNPINPPILVFPEGTCINNTSVMQFKKGSFEVGGVIYPVAIKYDPRFGDAFWNSSKYSMLQYLYLMMTSWAIVCDVWYLPPMYQNENESGADFANRVKRVIADQGGLVDLVWDGQLKRSKPKKEWKERQQEEFSKRLKVE